MNGLETITDASPEIAVTLALVIALTQLAKALGMRSDFAPSLAILIGIGVGVVFFYFPAVFQVVAPTVLAAAGASGVYSWSKNKEKEIFEDL